MKQALLMAAMWAGKLYELIKSRQGPHEPDTGMWI